MFNPKDNMGILLQGTEESENSLDFQNIVTLKSLGVCSIDDFTFLDELRTCLDEGDCMFLYLKKFLRVS